MSSRSADDTGQGALDGDLAESAEEPIVEGEVSGEEAPQGAGAENVEATTPRAGLRPLTRFGEHIRSTLDRIREPRTRGPIRFGSRDPKPSSPSAPGDNDTTGNAPGSASADGGGEAAA